nr:indolepyruvate ferredoxin oxidoreductase subunit alpha [uncultured Holophaga sp.]
MKQLMTGDEAVARGAWEAGVTFASAYPGTPSTEILENLATYEGVMAEWGVNEKVALEATIGASFAGARTLCAMKHVGLNVAADPLFTLSYLGVSGGLVVVSADEPGMHSSQNEQDNRHYARAAKIPMLEPATAQESLDMVKAAFELSETHDTPVLFRMTTRVCHSKGIVSCGERVEVPNRPYTRNIRKRIPVPAFTTAMRVRVEERTERLRAFSESTPLNYTEMKDTRIGVIASGVAHCYAQEVFGESASYLKLGFTWPLPEAKIRDFCSQVETVYVLEENDALIEETVRRLGFECRGKDLFPYTGELTPDVIRKAIHGQTLEAVAQDTGKVVPRPPTLCAGCPHRGFFVELGKLKGIVISGDIGCYGLAFAEPYNAVDWSCCMGASMSMGHGAQQVFSRLEGTARKRVVSVLGDSTFLHTGINSLINVAYNRSTSINVILDNRITGMTGHQENPVSGRTLQGLETPEVDLEAIVKALGFRHVAVIDPNDLTQVREALQAALKREDEASVIITRWPCVLKKLSNQDKTEFPEVFKSKSVIDQDKCIGCKSCIKTGCPALSYNAATKQVSILRDQCVGCGVCIQTCPPKIKAISKELK